MRFNRAGHILILFAVAASIASRPAHAQAVFSQPAFVEHHLGIEDGLPVNEVRAVARTPDGFIWLATVEGLVRFDGAEFVVFNAGNTPGFSTNRLRKLRVSHDGYLVIQPETGPMIVRRPDGTIEPVMTGDVPVEGEVIAESVYPHAGLVIATDGGELMIYRPGGRFDVMAAPNEIGRGEDASTFSFELADDGSLLWFAGPQHPITAVGSDGRMIEFDNPGRNAPTIIDGHSVSRSGVHRFIDSDGRILRMDGSRLIVEDEGPVQGWYGSRRFRSCVEVDPDGRVWFAGQSPRPLGTSLFTYYRGEVELVIDRFDSECSGYEDDAGDFILSTGRGLFRNGRLVSEGHRYRPYEDRDGTVWSPSLNGIWWYTRGVPRMISGLSDDNTYSVVEDALGRVWIGVWKGDVSHVVDGQRVFDVPLRHRTALQARDGTFWLGPGFTQKPLARVRPERVSAIAAPFDILSTVELGGATLPRVIFEDSTGDIWIGTDWGLQRKQGERVRLEMEVSARTAVEEPTGSIWFGTNGQGLVRYRRGEFTTFGVDAGLSSPFIRGLMIDSDIPGRIWIATEDRGLNRLDLGEDGDPADIVVFTREHGLFRNGLHNVIEDNDGRLWMNTNYGVSYVWKDDLNAIARGELDRAVPVSYTERDGLLNREGNGGMHTSALKTRDGRIWFASREGVSVFDPRELTSRKPPRVAITAAKARGTPVALEGEDLTFSPDQRDFSIDFTAPEFTAPERLRFEVRLSGYDETWQITRARTVTFTNIPPDDYVFEARVVARGDGAPITRLPIQVLPRWFETGWFKLIAALALLVGAVLTPAVRLRRARRRERELNRLVAERTHALRERSLSLRHEKEVTERQAHELEELNRAKSRFFANISHEFRTPLTLILGPLKQFLDREDDRDAATHRMMYRNAEKLLEMVNGILELSRLESKSLPMNPECANLTERARSAVHRAMPLAERRGITLLMIDSPDLFAMFDPDLMDRVISNLLSNAVKFTDEGGHVYVSVRTAGPDVCLRVRDTGQGIPDDKLPLIFDRFYQTDTSSKRRHEGTGIGLSLVKEIIDLHDGSVVVRSSVGRGSTFTVSIPLVPESVEPRVASVVSNGRTDRSHFESDIVLNEPEGDHAAAAAAAPAAAAASADDDRTTVLLVDDNEDVREFIRTVLSRDFRIVEAVDGRDALEKIASDVPDIVVSDVMMPRMDGLEMVRVLKADPETDAVPVILLTALAGEEHQMAGLKEDAELYLTKPIDGELLLHQVRGVLRRRRRLRDRILAASSDEELARFGLFTGHDEAATEEDEPGPFEASVRAIIESRIVDAHLTAAGLAEAVGLSYSQLHRRLKAEADMTPTELIRSVRLERAVEMMSRDLGTISEIAYAVGFNSLSYFNRSFKAIYGTSPSSYRSTTTD